jgi:hypothetical protein
MAVSEPAQPLLVAAAIAERDRPEPLALVEVARSAIDLEAVQVEASGTTLLGEVDESSPQAAPDPGGRHVQLLDHRVRQRHQPDDGALAVDGDPGLVAG